MGLSEKMGQHFCNLCWNRNAARTEDAEMKRNLDNTLGYIAHTINITKRVKSKEGGIV